MAFSPSGKYMALSKQGYIPYREGEFWGHVPSCDIYISESKNPYQEICHFCDHGDEITGVAYMHDTVSSTSFSFDEKRILSVSRDGVVVVRNLY